MSILRAAFAKRQGEFKDLEEMVDKALEASKHPRRKLKLNKVTVALDSATYERNICKTLYQGLGSLRPASLLRLPAGGAAQVKGQPCRISFCLSDGQHSAVIVQYHSPQPVAGADYNSRYGFHQLADIQPCDCQGYIHKNSCKPS